MVRHSLPFVHESGLGALPDAVARTDNRLVPHTALGTGRPPRRETSTVYRRGGVYAAEGSTRCCPRVERCRGERRRPDRIARTDAGTAGGVSVRTDRVHGGGGRR